jgi:hypothetical protein
MTRTLSLCLRVLPLASLSGLPLVPSAVRAEDDQALRWVAEAKKPALRVSRDLILRELQKAAALLFPSDHRFTLKRLAITMLPIENLIQLKAEGKASVAFVRDKRVSVSARVRAHVDGETVRLVYEGMKHNLSHCEAEGPVCFMLKRAIETHVADGKRIQEALDDGVNAALRPVFRELAQISCAPDPIVPKRVHTAPEFLEIIMTGNELDLDCKPKLDFLPSSVRSRAPARALPARARTRRRRA